MPNGTLGAGLITNFTKPTALSRRSVYVHAPYDVPPQQVQQADPRRDRRRLGRAARAAAVGRHQSPSTSAACSTGCGSSPMSSTSATAWTAASRDCIWYAFHRAPASRSPAAAQAVTLRPPPAEPPPDDRPRASACCASSTCSATCRRRPAPAGRNFADPALRRRRKSIVRQGDPGEELFVVLQRAGDRFGATRPAPTRTHVTRAGAGQFLRRDVAGDRSRRTATVQAKDECEVLVIGAATFRQLLDSSPDLVVRVGSVVAHRQANLDDHIETLNRGAGDDDKQHFLLRFPGAAAAAEKLNVVSPRPGAAGEARNAPLACARVAAKQHSLILAIFDSLAQPPAPAARCFRNGSANSVSRRENLPRPVTEYVGDLAELRGSRGSPLGTAAGDVDRLRWGRQDPHGDRDRLVEQ